MCLLEKVQLTHFSVSEWDTEDSEISGTNVYTSSVVQFGLDGSRCHGNILRASCCLAGVYRSVVGPFRIPNWPRYDFINFLLADD